MVQKNRVVYFSKQDMASGHMLEKAEKIFDKFDESFVYTDINDIIELYQIKRYIDADLFLEKWNKTEIDHYKSLVSKFWSIINNFSGNINDKNIESYFKSVADWRYSDAFWQLVDKCKIYKRITIDRFKELLNKRSIRDILKHKNITIHYNETIKSFLLDYDSAAEIILSKYEKEKDCRDTSTYLPESLTLANKADILDKYIDLEDANLNYIKLIIIAKNTAEFNIPDKIRLKAKRREKIETERLLNSNSIDIGYQIRFAEDQTEPVSIVLNGFNMQYSYSVPWIKEHFDTLSLFQNFHVLFGMLDEQYRISLVSKKAELTLMDRFGLHSQNEYPDGFQFKSKNNTAWIQTFAYSHVLEKLGVLLENVINEGFNENILSKNIENMNVIFPSKKSSNMEKIRFLLPEMESLMKKYKIYAENQTIDPELLSISSTPCRIQDIPSTLKKKYVYGVDAKIANILYYFFSDQSMLYYVKPFQDKYQSLCDLLINENVRFEDLENYQLPVYQNLISEQYLTIEDGYIRINKVIELAIYRELYHHYFISYHHLNPLFKITIDKLFEDGFVEFGNTLLSKSEISYFSYYLNKSEYTNGYDLRNKYAHGTHHSDEKIIEHDYYWILILLALLELKIIDDIDLSQAFGKG